jgi:hypothetical protein
MSTCVCHSASIDILKVGKFESVKQIIKDKHLAHVNDQTNLMFCSPVGNQELFGPELKANIVLSGFCVAPDAAIGFAEDLAKTSLRQATVDNAFNTPTMRRGIKKIFKSIGIKNDSALEESIRHESVTNAPMRFLMTQMLCMISADGGSKAKDVINLLESHKEIRAQAERCLGCWVKRIQETVEPGSIILLMGDDAFKLINETEFYSDGSCTICLDGQIDGESLFAYLKRSFPLFMLLESIVL